MAIDNPVVKASVNKVKEEVRFSASSILIDDNGTVRTLQEAWDLLMATIQNDHNNFNVISGVVGSNIPIPEQKGKQYYTGNTVEAVFENYVSTWMSVTGNRGKEAKTYSATFTLTSESYTWEDGSKTPKTVEWTIYPRELASIPVQVNIPEYNGDIKTPQFSNYEASWFVVDLDSEYQSVNVGTHTIKMKPADNHRWSEALTETLGDAQATANIQWRIDPKRVTLPYQISVEDFDGTLKRPVWNYDYSRFLDAEISAKREAATHAAYFTPKDVAVWSDTETRERRTAYWIINTAGIPKISCDEDTKTLIFSGQNQHPAWVNFTEDSPYIEVTGPLTARNKGVYVTTFKPVSGTVWTDGTNGIIKVKWKIEPLAVDIPVVTQLEIPVYNTHSHSPMINNMDSNWITKQGDVESLAGTHTVTFELLAEEKALGNLVWNNAAKTQTAQSFEWQIKHKKISAPDFEKMSQELYYNEGKPVGPITLMPEGKEGDLDNIIVEGVTKATEVSGYGEYYSITFRPMANYCWEDETRNTLTFTWRILSNPVSLPTIAGTYSYTGKEQTISYNGSKVDIEIVNNSNIVKNRGTYTVEFKLAKAGSHWSGLTGAAATANYTLQVVVDYLYVVIPELAQSIFDYTGATINLDDYYAEGKQPDLDWVSVTGDTGSAVNNYKATYTLKGNTAGQVNVRWNGTTSSQPQYVDWQIRSPENTFILSSTEGVVEGVEGSAATTFTVTCKGDIGVTVASKNTMIATASIIDQSYNTETTTLTTTVRVVDGGTSGKTEIDIMGTQNGGFTAPAAKQFTVTVQPYRALANCSAKDAERVVKDGKADNLWNVGDYLTISLNGSAEAATLYGITGSARIIFLEYRSGRAYFLLSGTTGNFCGAFYHEAFTHALTSTALASSYGNSYVKNTVMPKFTALLPEDWRQLLSKDNNKTVYSYQEAKAVRGNYNTRATATDYFFIPSYTEIWGTPSNSPGINCPGDNDSGTPVKLAGYLGGESNQAQFEYFKNNRPYSDVQPQWVSNYENCAGKWARGTYAYKSASKYNILLRGCLYQGPAMVHRENVDGTSANGIQNALVDGMWHCGSILPIFSLGST